MRITSVEKSRKGRKYNIYVDGKFLFPVSDEEYFSLNLYENRDFTEQELEGIISELHYKEAKEKATVYISSRLRSAGEVSLRLKREGYSNTTIERVVEELKSIGYINDRLFIGKYIFDRLKMKPKAKRMLKYELLNKGIEEAVIDEVLEEWKVDEEIVAENMVRRKFGKYDFSDEEIKKKVRAFLYHRGYNLESIENIIKKMNNI